MASRHLKTTLFNFSEELECPQFPKLRLLRCQNFLKVFSPSVLLGSACGAWPLGPQLPEATHRCTTQPWRATLRSSSGSSRPRRKWMRRPTTAVASDEGFGDGKPSWGNGIFTWGSEWNVDGSSCFRCLAILWKVFCRNIWYWDFVFLFFILTVLFLHLELDIFQFFWKVCRNICSNIWCFFVSMLSALTIFLFGSILERPLQSKIDHTFPAQFNAPWHPTL